MINSALEGDYKEFFEFLEYKKFPVNYNLRFREFYINANEGSSGMILSFCPLSGKVFPSSLREIWFDQIELLGIDDAFDQISGFEPKGKTIPKEYLSEEWWIKQGL